MTPYQKRVVAQGRGRKDRLLYNIWWNATEHPLEIELEMIRGGGQWEKQGVKFGNGLTFHYKKAVEIIWPEIKQHRWFDKFLETWLTHKYMGVLGPASSGKTLCAAIVHLIDYYAFPHNTTILICSTTKESLENRIWGEIKKWHRLARERVRWLTGNLIEGRTRLVTDHRDDAEDGRDFRNGFCFPSGTLVDTPNGPSQIETLQVGDIVINALGIGTITDTQTRRVKRLVRVNYSGRYFECTPDHRILTTLGWKKAVDLTTYDTVLSGNETVQVMWQSATTGIPKQEVLQRRLSKLLASETLQVLSEDVSTNKPEASLVDTYNGVLLKTLREPLGISPQRMSNNNEALCALWENHVRCSHYQNVLFHPMSQPATNTTVSTMRKGIPVHSGIPEETTHSFLQSTMQKNGRRSVKLEEENKTHNSGIGGMEPVSRIHHALPFPNRTENQERVESLVPDGYCVSETKTGCGDRRGNTPGTEKEVERRKTNGNTQPIRVESVEILEPSGDERFDARQGGYLVHNITVSGHPSYSVAGVIVHNCGVPLKKGNVYVGMSEFLGIKNDRIRLCGDELQCCPKSFLDVTVNLSGNRDFKCTGMGNPADTLDALGILCEPHASLGGWESGLDQTPKTKTWNTRFENGVCLQLPGSDCPNMDAKENEEVPFPFLITRQKMKADASTWGKDDWHYKMFDEGMMPRGQGSRRVITRQLCIKHGAMESPVWKNHIRTKIGCLDAAYRAVGGDRCVFGELHFGEERDDENISGEELAESVINQRIITRSPKPILALASVSIIPIEAFASESPEDQIVTFVKKRCEEHGIPPSHFFFDSGMRTSLVTSFSRLWSNMVNPIDCGGRPTERTVSDNINMMCCDYYSKFITELWWSVRLIIESGQFRGMTEDVMQEGCSREWKMVGANKIEVESKSDMKEKTGRSPDLFDMLAVGCEGARRLGFVIRKLANKECVNLDDGWKRDLKHKAHDRFKAKQLVHS